jgi:hypothetical protein
MKHTPGERKSKAFAVCMPLLQGATMLEIMRNPGGATAGE